MAVIGYDPERDEESAGGGASEVHYPDTAPNVPPKPPTGGGGVGNDYLNNNWADIEKQLREASGGLYDPSDLEGIKRNLSYTNADGGHTGMTLEQALANQRGIYGVRAASGGDRDSGGYDTNLPDNPAARSASGGGTGSVTVPGQFTDPITSFLEQFAQQRAQQLENPAAGSGQSLLEQALQSIAQSLQGGGYTTAEQETFQTQALDPLEQLRTQRKQQVIQQLSARGIPMSSGVAQSMLADVDRQFDGLRTTTQRELASNIAQDGVNRQLQAVELLTSLAGTQDTRLDKAYDYRTVPLNLADRSWSQAMQLLQMNDPLSLVSGLTGQANTQQAQLDSLQETLGYLAYVLANRG